MQRPESPATLDEGTRKDKGYRRYASNVERALSLFDTALQEWADYIAFLGRLLKALQSRPSDVAEIPHGSIVAKRLAQCLAPTLGAGVHQKTLEVYAYVFSVVGKDGLSRDLSLWLPGLSPTLSFASLSIKPTLLSLFETFIVSLEPTVLRSALRAIILTLLPGLEDETSEEYERTLVLLNKFRDAVSQNSRKASAQEDVAGDQYFWQSLFLASITSSSRRQGALSYLTRELPRMGKSIPTYSDPQTVQQAQGDSKKYLPPAFQAVTSPEPGLLIRCFVVGLQDEQLLNQRGFLDLLVSHLPLHSLVLREKVTSEDVELLIMAAVSVVSRREMSLNRRLWSWLLGPETTSEKDDNTSGSPSPDSMGSIAPVEAQNMSQTKYFERYGLQQLSNGILKLLDNDALTPLEKARPFRTCLSLMDRWEIGGLVVPRIFLPAMKSVWRYQNLAPSKDAFTDILRSANVFFDGIESGLIWAELTRMMVRAVNPEADGKESGTLVGMGSETLLNHVQFVITHFNLQEEEMITIHIPMATLALLISLRLLLEGSELATVGGDFVVPKKACKVATRLLDVMPQRIITVTHSVQREAEADDGKPSLKKIQQFYNDLRSGSEDVTPPLHIGVINGSIIRSVSQIATLTLGSATRCVDLLELVNDLLDKVLRKTTTLNEYEYGQIMSSLVRASEILTTHQATESFATIAAYVSILETLKRASTSGLWELDHRVRQLLLKLLTNLWRYTSPSQPRHNVEAVRCLWRIHSISPEDYLVEGSLASLLFHDTKSDAGRAPDLESARRFAVVWAHCVSTANISGDRRSSLGHGVAKQGCNAIKVSRESRMLERPLLVLLDSLFDKGTELSTFISSWLQSLSSIQR